MFILFIFNSFMYIHTRHSVPISRKWLDIGVDEDVLSGSK